MIITFKNLNMLSAKSAFVNSEEFFRAMIFGFGIKINVSQIKLSRPIPLNFVIVIICRSPTNFVSC
jgi:hypothetical protein